MVIFKLLIFHCIHLYSRPDEAEWRNIVKIHELYESSVITKKKEFKLYEKILKIIGENVTKKNIKNVKTYKKINLNHLYFLTSPNEPPVQILSFHQRLLFLQ